jgi:hypothetical protein
MRTAGLATLGTGRYRAPIYARHDNKLLAIALLEATHVFNVAVYLQDGFRLRLQVVPIYVLGSGLFM